MADLKEISRQKFTAISPTSHEEIKTGCLQRIADSLEKMEQPYLRLLNDVKYLTERNRGLNETIQSLQNKLRATKGHVTRLKRKEASHA